jgi:hypothetical protein
MSIKVNAPGVKEIVLLYKGKAGNIVPIPGKDGLGVPQKR